MKILPLTTIYAAVRKTPSTCKNSLELKHYLQVSSQHLETCPIQKFCQRLQKPCLECWQGLAHHWQPTDTLTKAANSLLVLFKQAYFWCVKSEKIPVKAPTVDEVERSLPKRGNACPITREIVYRKDDRRNILNILPLPFSGRVGQRLAVK